MIGVERYEVQGLGAPDRAHAGRQPALEQARAQLDTVAARLVRRHQAINAFDADFDRNAAHGSLRNNAAPANRKRGFSEQAPAAENAKAGQPPGQLPMLPSTRW